ncbi:Protein NLRC3, partial [Durusdinium trenchii]
AIWSTDRAFLAKLCDQTFTAWGEKSSGADISTVKPKLDSIGVEAIWSTSGAFLAKLRDGSFLAWGDKYRGADLTTVAHGSDLVGAEGIWSTDYAFFAKLRNGNFRAWGDGTYGALITRTIENDLKKGLEAVWSTSGAFLAKLCDGSFTAWGDKDRGADISAVQDHLELLGVEAVWSTSAAFLAKLCDGSFIAWGDPAWGADISEVKAKLDSIGVEEVSNDEGGSWNEDLLQKEFLEWQRTGLTPLPVVRMCFVGRGRAGKTTTLRRLKGEELKEDERSTHGVEVWAGQMREDLVTGEQGWKKLDDGGMFERSAKRGLQEQLAKRHMKEDVNAEAPCEPSAEPQDSQELQAVPTPAHRQRSRRFSKEAVKDHRDHRVASKAATPAPNKSPALTRIHSRSETKAKVETLGPAPMGRDMVVDLGTASGIELRLQSWDFPGQQEYALLNLLYFNERGIYLVFCDMSGDIEEEWSHLSFWLWAIAQYAKATSPRKDAADTRPKAPNPPILLVGTKMGNQKIKESELQKRVEGLLQRVPQLKQQLQPGPRLSDESRCSWLFPVENKPTKENVEHWIAPLRERIQKIALQLVTPRDVWSDEAYVPDFVGLQATRYPTPWLRAHDLLAELGEGFRATVSNLPDGLIDGKTKLVHDLRVNTKNDIPLIVPAGAVLHTAKDFQEPRFRGRSRKSKADLLETDVLVSCDFLPLSSIQKLLGGMQPAGISGRSVADLLRLLSSLGILLWFDEEHLRNLVMLNPRRLAVALADLMTLCFGEDNFAHGDEYNAALREKKGQVSPADLLWFQTTGVATRELIRCIWSDFDEAEQDLMLEILLRRGLLVRRAVEDEFIVPSCLPMAHLAEPLPDKKDAVLYVDLGGVLSPNLFPMLAERIYASPGKSVVVKPGPPQLFRNRLESSAGGNTITLSLFPAICQQGNWLVRIHVQAKEKADVEANPNTKAKAIEKLLLDVMGIAGSRSGALDIRRRLRLDVGKEDLESFCIRTPCLSADCKISCVHCKLWNLLQERYHVDMNPELQDVVKQVALEPDVRPTGSFKFKSVRFPGDVDLYEYLIFEARDPQEALSLLCETLKSRAKSLELWKNIFFSGLKAGKDHTGQYLVWNLDELQAGRKELTDSKSQSMGHKTLQEALEEGHITGTAKMDVYARIPLFNEQNRRFYQITNVLRLGYLPRSDGLPNGKESIPGKRLFSIQPITREDDHLRAVEHDLQNYSGPHPKMMKYLKRLWERSAFLAQRGFDLDWHVNILEAIQPVFQHWVARLGAMADHVETLWYMLRDNNPKAQQKASEDIQSLRQAMNSLLEELQKKCEHVHHVPGGGSSIEEAGEGAQSLMEALKHLNRLPTSVQGAMDVPVTMHLLGRAQTLLTCCVEAVIFNKMSLFPPLAQPRNDWDFASDHLPIGARLHFSKGKEHLSSFNIASWNISHKSDASSKDEVLAIKEVKELLHHSEIHILCLQECDHGFLEDLRSNLPSPFKMLSKEGAGEVIIYNAYIIALTKFVVHCKDFAYKSNPKKESSLKMVIKGWPKEATYDRVRVTDWLLQRANLEHQTQQEHGYYTAARRFTLSPVTILKFQDYDAQQAFEKFAYSNFSGKHPLHYWDGYGNRLQHWKGGWRKLVITNYLGKVDLTINMALTTALHILTSQPDTPYAGTSHLSHRPTDKQLYDLQAKKVIAKVTYDKDRGVLALIAQGELMDTLRNYWHETWKEVHKDHPRYPSYNRYPLPVCSDLCGSTAGR